MLDSEDHQRVLALEIAVSMLAAEMKQTTGFDLSARLREVAEYFTTKMGDPDPGMHRLHLIGALEELATHCEEDY